MSDTSHSAENISGSASVYPKDTHLDSFATAVRRVPPYITVTVVIKNKFVLFGAHLTDARVSVPLLSKYAF